jgi:hypothetical protein
MNGENLNGKSGAPGALGRLQDRFAQWRQQSGPGQRRRIPNAFWEEASVLARQQGVFKVARTLRLDYATLKKRAGVNADRQRQQTPVPFVELMMSGPTATSENVIELVNRQGARMTLRLHPACRQAIVDLAEVFLRQRK